MVEKIIITEKQIQNIKKQIDNSFCKIECNKEEDVIGFFCYLPIENEINLLPVIIVNNFIKNESDKITIYKNNICLSLSIDKKRKIFVVEEDNITIIEIKEDDNLDMNSFLDIDEDIYKEDLKESFVQKIIYLLYYSKSKDIKYSLGVIKDIDEGDDYKFEYLCDTENDSPSMGLIFNLSNFKIIGFHLGAKKGENLNSGIFINVQLDNFHKYLKKLNDNYQGSNEITIIYKNIKLKRKYLKEDSEIKLTKNNIILFGEKFVEKNKEICKILIEGKEKELVSLYSNERLKENEKFEIKLKGIKDIIDMSYMFYGCFSLFSIPDISKWNTFNVTNMSHAFDGCISLIDLPDISKLNTFNVSDMSYMFKDCESLQTLPDITKWRMDCVTNVSYIFFKSKYENIKENIEKIKRENNPIKITEKDIPQIQEIFISYWGTKSLEDYIELKRIINYNLSYAYKVNDNLIGFCLMENKSEEDSIYVDLLCIRKEYSGNHFGESLLKYCIGNCQKMKYENFSLHVTTKNTPALNLYKKLGFGIKEFLKEYYEDQEPGNNDAYFMTLNTSKK